MTSSQRPPLISVIVPLHNGESTGTYAIDSLLSQTLPHSELIVMDDCSFNHNPKLSRELRQDAGNGLIRMYFQERNRGSEAQSRSTREACADYLTVCVYVAVSAAKRQNCPDVWLGRATGGVVLSEALRGKTWNYLHGKLYRTRLFEHVRFPEELVRYEDRVFIACAYSYSRVVEFCAEDVYLYYIQSTSATWSQRPLADYIEKILRAISQGAYPAALAVVATDSWDSARTFLVVIIYSGRIFVRHARHELPMLLLLLLMVATIRPGMEILEVIFHVTAWFYGALPRWYHKRTFRMTTPS